MVGLVTARWIDATSLPLELVSVTVANAVAAVLRFAVLRGWVFRPNVNQLSPPQLITFPEATS